LTKPFTFAKILCLLKQVLVSLLLMAFALQTFNRVVMLFDYQLNTQSYIKDCENKARPQLHCNGQCKLMKKLRKEAQKDTENPERRAENRNEFVFFSQSFSPVNRVVTILSSSIFIHRSQGAAIKMPRTILRPPIFG
jgi:hypothetical protein